MSVNEAQGIFVTGTDTAIGKTVVSCQLIDTLALEGNKVIGMKPIASGAEKQNGMLKNEDALQLIEHANIDVPYELINPFCFEPAIAPHIAAKQAGEQIDFMVIEKAYHELTKQADWVVVEGVGGWSVPLSNKHIVADIPTRLNLPVVLVVGMRLGCINHALLTAEVIRNNGNNLVGWIANKLDQNMRVYEENLQTLKDMLSCPIIGQVPYIPAGQTGLDQLTNIETKFLKT